MLYLIIVYYECLNFTTHANFVGVNLFDCEHLQSNKYTSTKHHTRPLMCTGTHLCTWVDVWVYVCG